VDLGNNNILGSGGSSSGRACLLLRLETVETVKKKPVHLEQNTYISSCIIYRGRLTNTIRSALLCISVYSRDVEVLSLIKTLR